MISVIIPVKNGGATLERCLQSIRDQKDVYDLEIIVIDSVSNDQSVEIAKRFNTRIISIKSENFNHGLTRNIAVEFASNKLVFFTVQDSFIANEYLLREMANHFSDKNVMGVCGHQAVPHERDKNPLLWFKRFTDPKPVFRSLQGKGNIDHLTQQEKKHLIAWDNVVAMYRKEALELLPFRKTNYAEDWMWSYDALKLGWKLVYDPSLVVFHYHHQNFTYAYKVAYTINYTFYHSFNFKPERVPIVLNMIKAGYRLIKRTDLTISEKFYWLIYALKYEFGTWSSHLVFRLLLLFGKNRLIDLHYRQVCKSVPQGQQNKK